MTETNSTFNHINYDDIKKEISSSESELNALLCDFNHIAGDRKMGTELDIDDVCAGHRLAQSKLDLLRELYRLVKENDIELLWEHCDCGCPNDKSPKSKESVDIIRTLKAIDSCI